MALPGPLEWSIMIQQAVYRKAAATTVARCYEVYEVLVSGNSAASVVNQPLRRQENLSTIVTSVTQMQHFSVT